MRGGGGGRQKHKWNDTVRQVFLTHTRIVAGIRDRMHARTYARTLEITTYNFLGKHLFID